MLPSSGPAPAEDGEPSPPPDLLAFLRSPEHRTLLITGEPGVGKTTLSLSLLSALARPSFYVSTRVGRGNLLHHFPWLVGSLAPDRIADLEDVRPPSDRQEDLLHMMDHMTDSVDPLSAGRRLRDFLNFPEPIARALAEAPARAGHRYLFIDSWEGLVEPYLHLLGLDDLGRSSLEHGLLSLLHAAGFSLVLDAESVAPPSLQYLADGVVELHAEPSSAGLLRHLEIRKLRGHSIPRARLVFTLDQGRFTYLPPLPPPRSLPGATIYPAISPPTPHGNLSLGIPALDREIGPISPGETLLAESEGGGSSTPLAAVLFPLWLRALRDGWKVSLLMDLAHSPATITQGFRAALPDPEMAERLSILPNPSRTRPQEVWEDLLATLKERTAVDVSVRTLSVLMSETGEALLARLGQLLVQARESKAVLVLITSSPNPLLPVLSTLVPIHLVLRNYHGSVLLQGSHPCTPALGIMVRPEPVAGHRYRYVTMA